MSSVVQQLLEQSGALQRGHFRLSSGLHSDQYCQCARLFENPLLAAQAASELRRQLPQDFAADCVLAPALGAILWGYEAARALGIRSLFAERKPGEPFQLRRGFTLHDEERVLLAEDVVTTGGSVMELVPLVESYGAEVVGFASVVDRSRGAFDPGKPFWALAQLEFETHPPEECPLCANGTPLDTPGSRSF